MSTKLTRTNSGGSSGTKWTRSLWVKRGALGASQSLCAAGSYITFTSTDFIEVLDSAGAGMLVTNRKFRDPSAWYHIVLTYDSTAGSSDRLILYVNGVRETSFSTNNQPALNQVDTATNNGQVQYIATRTGSNYYFLGNMAHVYFTDGYAYPASSFGETDSTSGIWVAKSSPSVTYGNNGFFLKFASGASGTDSSGNSNDFTVTGTMTNLKDSPDNNFATMNPLDNYFANQTFTNTNNTVKSDHPAPAVGTIALTSGKWYFEGKAIVSTSGSDWQFGLVSKQRSASEQEIGNFPSEYSYRGSNGYIRTDNSETSYGATYTTGDIIGCAVDLTNLKLYFSKNGVWQNSGVPTSGATGTGAISITDPATISGQNQIEAYLPAAGADASANDYTWSMNFGNGYFGTTIVSSSESDDAGIGSFEYDVPAGYYALCTTNLGDQS